MDKFYYIKIKNACFSKEVIKKARHNYIYIYLFRIYKELQINKKKTTQQKKGENNTHEQAFLRKRKQMMNKPEKGARPYFISREIKFVTTLRCHLTISRERKVKMSVLVICCSVPNYHQFSGLKQHTLSHNFSGSGV